MTIATKRPTKKSTGKASGTRKKAGAQPSKAEHYDSRVVKTDDCKVTFMDAQDSKGQYYGDFGAEWINGVELPKHTAHMTPSRQQTYGTLELAHERVLQAATLFIERLRLDHRTDKELEAIGEIEGKLYVELQRGQATRQEADGKLLVDMTDEEMRDKFGGATGSASAPSSQDNSPDLCHFTAKQLTRVGEAKRLELIWPIDKLSRHPLNRQIDPAHVVRLKKLLAVDGQRDAIECRVTPAAWAKRRDAHCVPEGHVQILRGHHRRQAAELLGWDEVRVVIYADLDDRAAMRLLARSDDQAKWNELAKGRLASEMRACGLTVDDVATEFACHKGTVSHWTALAKLPDYLQKVVDPGVPIFDVAHKKPTWWAAVDTVHLPASWLRPLEKHADSPPLLRLIFDLMMSECREYPEEWLANKVEFAKSVEHAISHKTYPVDAVDKSFNCYVAGKNKTFGRLFELTDELEQQLGIVDLEIGEGKQQKIVRRATNRELYERLQSPLEKLFREGKIDSAGRPSKKSGSKSTGKASGTQAKMGGTGSASAVETEAQRKARVKQEQAEAHERRQKANAALKDKIARWRQRLLRLQIAKQLRPHDGDWLVPMILPWLLTSVQNDYRTHWIDKVICYVGTGKQKQLDSGQRWRAITAKVDTEDPLRDVEENNCEICRLLLWPVMKSTPAAPRSRGAGSVLYHEPPSIAADVPFFDGKVIEQIAALAEVDLAAAWRTGSDSTTVEHILLREFFELHSTDQLVDVAKQLLPASRSNKSVGKLSIQLKKADRVNGFLKLHESSPLKLPKSIKPL